MDHRKLGVGAVGLQAGRPEFWESSTLVETREICDTWEERLAK